MNDAHEKQVQPTIFSVVLQFTVWAGIAQSVQRIATDWIVRDRTLVWDQIFRTRPDRSGVHPASYTVGTGSYSQG
jgi:hypothetical protein